MPLYILFLGTFIYIAFYQTWQYPYTHLLVLINFTALITQLTVFYFEREMVYNVFIKPRLESRKKTVNKATK